MWEKNQSIFRPSYELDPKNMQREIAQLDSCENKPLFTKLNDNILIEKNSQLKQQLINLINQPQILICLDKDKNFFGTITDGDIRRGFVKKFNLKTPVYKITKLNQYL